MKQESASFCLLRGTTVRRVEVTLNVEDEPPFDYLDVRSLSRDLVSSLLLGLDFDYKTNLSDELNKDLIDRVRSIGVLLYQGATFYEIQAMCMEALSSVVRGFELQNEQILRALHMRAGVVSFTPKKYGALSYSYHTEGGVHHIPFHFNFVELLNVAVEYIYLNAELSRATSNLLMVERMRGSDILLDSFNRTENRTARVLLGEDTNRLLIWG